MRTPDSVERELNKRFDTGYLVLLAVHLEADRRTTLVKQSKAWRKARNLPKTTGEEKTVRNSALNAARMVYELDEQPLIDWAIDARRKSGWMVDHIDSQTTKQLARRVWSAFADHLFRGKGKPKRPLKRDFDTLEGVPRNAKNGEWQSITLRGLWEPLPPTPIEPTPVEDAPEVELKPVRKKRPQTRTSKPVLRKRGWDNYEGPPQLVWNTRKGNHRELIAVLKTHTRSPQTGHAHQREEYDLAHPEKWRSVKIVRRQQVKGPRVHYVFETHLTVEGPAWRVPGRYDDPFGVKDNTVGLDLGVPSLACVAVNDKGITQALLVKASNEDKAKEVKAQKKARKRAKSLERSRRNNNPDSFKRGKKGKKAGGARKPGTKLTYSNRYAKTRVKQATQARAGALERKRRIEITAAQIVRELGPNLMTEKVKPKQWTCLWGKQIGQFAPSKLMKAIETEATRAGGSLTPFPTNTTALSQTCLCGKKVKKPLSQRTHACDCVTINGQEIHRDLFSAFLATSVTKTQKPTTTTTTSTNTTEKITSTDLNPEEASSWVWTLDTALATTRWVGAGDAGICLRSAVSKVNVTRVPTTPDPSGSSGVERVALKPDCFTNTHKVVNTPPASIKQELAGGSVEGMRKVKNIKEPHRERRKQVDAKTSTRRRH